MRFEKKYESQYDRQRLILGINGRNLYIVAKNDADPEITVVLFRIYLRPTKTHWGKSRNPAVVDSRDLMDEVSKYDKYEYTMSWKTLKKLLKAFNFDLGLVEVKKILTELGWELD